MAEATALRSAKPWRRFRRNAGMILGSRAVFGLVGLAAAAVAVRAVGIEGFGIIALLQAYVRVIAGLIRFESWAAVTRYGAGLMAPERAQDMRRLLGFTLRLDLIAFAVSIAVAAAAAPLAARLFDWPPEVAAVAPWFGLTVVFITGATPTGFLRLVDRFRVLAEQHALTALVRLIGAALVLGLGGGTLALIGVWAAASVLSGTHVMRAAWVEARRRGLTPRVRGSWAGLSAGFPRIWRFVALSNASSLVDTVISHGTVLAVGALLGPAGASLFALTRQLTEALRKLGTLLGPIVFPEIALMEAEGARRRIARLLRRSLRWAAVLLAVLLGALALGGEALLAALFGEPARAAAPLLLAAGSSAGLAAAGFALAPILLTIGRETAVLRSALLAMAVFVPLLVTLTSAFGLFGAGLALLAHQLLLQGLRLASARAGLKDRSATDLSPPRSPDRPPS